VRAAAGACALPPLRPSPPLAAAGFQSYAPCRMQESDFQSVPVLWSFFSNASVPLVRRSSTSEHNRVRFPGRAGECLCAPCPRRPARLVMGLVCQASALARQVLASQPTFLHRLRFDADLRGHIQVLAFPNARSVKSDAGADPDLASRLSVTHTKGPREHRTISAVDPGNRLPREPRRPCRGGSAGRSWIGRQARVRMDRPQDDVFRGLPPNRVLHSWWRLRQR
jgi:hypothetical protein